MATEKAQATIGLKVPLEVWEVWLSLPKEKKNFLKAVFTVLLVGATKAELEGCSGEIVLKADQELLGVLREALGLSDKEEKCKEVVKLFYERLSRGEIDIDRYNAPRLLRLYLKPCFE